MRIVFSVILCLTLFLNTAFAAPSLPNAGNLIQAGRSGKLTTSELVGAIDENISGGLVTILQLLYKAGLGIAVCIFIFICIKVLITSPQQKAQLKASLYPYFIGLLLFIAGVPIAIFIINIFTKFF